MSQATLGRLNRLKVTNSNSQILNTDNLGGDHDALLLKARDTISQENSKVTEIQEKHKNILMQHESDQTCTAECRQEQTKVRKEENEFKKAAHPGFVISFDYLDFQLQRKSMTMQSQNRDFHWSTTK